MKESICVKCGKVIRKKDGTRDLRRANCKDCDKIYHMTDNRKFNKRYNHIKSRCCSKTDKDYKRYGAKGVTFNWDSYEQFKIDMLPSFLLHVKKYGNKNTTIDRIDGTKGYSKENCRWATMKIQSRNKKTNRYITYKGKTMVIADWARELGCSRQALRYRLNQKWTPEQIIETPIDHANRLAKIT